MLTHTKYLVILTTAATHLLHIFCYIGLTRVKVIVLWTRLSRTGLLMTEVNIKG
jgi:hypothetical protein